MAKKTTKSDRQAVIDEIRKKQKSAERRRGFAILGVCVVIAMTILALAIVPVVMRWWDLREFNRIDLGSIGAPASVCQEPTTKKANGEADHVPYPTPVDYADSPPAFGSHWNEPGVAPAAFERKFYTANDRPELEALVHNLEHGYTILWYDETIADDDDMLNTVEGLADKFRSSDDNFREKFIAAPWTSEDGDPFPDGQHVALTHWSLGGGDISETDKHVGVWQYCSEPSGDALKTFMLDYPYTDSPEPDAG